MSACRAERDWRAGVDGRGMVSGRARSMGRRAAMASSSGGGVSGERRGKVRLWSWRVWWVRWVVRAVWAVINLEKGELVVILLGEADMERLSKA